MAYKPRESLCPICEINLFSFKFCFIIISHPCMRPSLWTLTCFWLRRCVIFLCAFFVTNWVTHFLLFAALFLKQARHMLQDDDDDVSLRNQCLLRSKAFTRRSAHYFTFVFHSLCLRKTLYKHFKVTSWQWHCGAKLIVRWGLPHRLNLFTCENWGNQFFLELTAQHSTTLHFQ